MANSEVTEEKVCLLGEGGGGIIKRGGHNLFDGDCHFFLTPPPKKKTGCGWRHLHNIMYLWSSTTQRGKWKVVKQCWQCSGKIWQQKTKNLHLCMENLHINFIWAQHLMLLISSCDMWKHTIYRVISTSIWQFWASSSCVKRCNTKLTSFNSTSCEWGHGLRTDLLKIQWFTQTFLWKDDLVSKRMSNMI